MMKIVALAALVTMLGMAHQSADTKRVDKLLANRPKASTIEIEYRPVRGLENQSAWHIGDSHWWVRLQPVDIYKMSELEKKRKYKVTGVILDQWYGAVQVWVEKLEYAD